MSNTKDIKPAESLESHNEMAIEDRSSPFAEDFKAYDGNFRSNFYAIFSKRVFDLIFAIVLLPILLPALIVLLVIVNSDGGWPLFRHERVGRSGRRFDCLKIRTMKVDAEALLEELIQNDPRFALEWKKHRKVRNDPRISRFGAALRKTGLDELPQIFNIVRGEMSFVGPRPMTIEEVEEIAATDQAFAEAYLSLRPGITGYWQISGRRDADISSRIACDKAYRQNVNFRGDLLILLKTIPEVIGGRGQ